MSLPFVLIPAAFSFSIVENRGFMREIPKLVTKWPSACVTGTSFSAPKISPYMTTVSMTFAITSPSRPFKIAFCSSVSFILNSIDQSPYIVLALRYALLTASKTFAPLKLSPTLKISGEACVFSNS